MATVAQFQTWLNEQLRALNTDESVFGSYILGILEGEETRDEKMEALVEILTETGAPNLTELVSTIYDKWLDCHPQTDATDTKKEPEIDVNAQLAKLLEKQKIQPVTREREYTEEERRIKAQILAQYSETPVSDEDDVVSDHEEAGAAGATGGLGFAPNTNKSDVMALQKERREQARLDSAAKKQKDKDDREKQKQLREEKKEKRKTVKGERRR